MAVSDRGAWGASDLLDLHVHGRTVVLGAGCHLDADDAVAELGVPVDVGGNGTTWRTEAGSDVGGGIEWLAEDAGALTGVPPGGGELAVRAICGRYVLADVACK